MNKAELIDKLSGPLGSRKAAADAVDGVLEHITRALVAGERVALTGFGVFEKVHRPARVGRNPRTGASVKIKKTSVPKFKAGQSLKDVVSGSKKLPKAAAATVRTAASPAKKATSAKKAPANKAAATKAPARRAAPAKRVVATKASAGKAAPAKTTAKTTANTTAKRATTKATAKKATTKATTRKTARKAVKR